MQSDTVRGLSDDPRSRRVRGRPVPEPTGKGSGRSARPGEVRRRERVATTPAAGRGKAPRSAYATCSASCRAGARDAKRVQRTRASATEPLRWRETGCCARPDSDDAGREVAGHKPHLPRRAILPAFGTAAAQRRRGAGRARCSPPSADQPSRGASAAEDDRCPHPHQRVVDGEGAPLRPQPPRHAAGARHPGERASYMATAFTLLAMTCDIPCRLAERPSA